ncbi:MAG: hypothetical protein EP332_14160 [Bacteroidetes bacterium]|nr:MAG: hypothetical protein EP332_14160 [Bacteroidota bacterium]
MKRQIAVYDLETDKLVEEIPLQSMDLEVWRSRLNASEDDPKLYDPYEITQETSDLFPLIEFNFTRYAYYLECYQD